MDKYRFFEFIFDNALEMYIIHDKNCKVVFANRNAEEELGYDDRLRGIDVFSIFQFNTSISESGLADELVYDGVEREMMVYRKNFTCFRASVKAITVDDEASPFIIIIRNISGRYFLEKTIENVKEEAEANARVKSEFVANVTHELRTPVNGILGNTRILLEREKEPDNLKILYMIEHGCNEMNNLINSILDFSKLDAGKFVLENREFEFRSMIDYIRSTHMPKITEKGLRFFVTVSPDIPERIIGDELRIGQILNNLLSNACKFTHVGKVSLEVLKTAQEKNRMELFFMVVDTGIGIDKADTDKLFKSFSQVDASVSRKYGGTGLGLNISKQLVELMGGNISVDSEINKGTMFSFSIWVDIPEDEQEENPVINIRTSKHLSDMMGTDAAELQKYGTTANLDELNAVMTKLVLCLEMNNWEKAECFTDTIKRLTAEAPKEIKTSALRLKMAVQKEDYDKSMESYEQLKSYL